MLGKNYEKNLPHAIPGPYETALPQTLEPGFQSWLKTNNVPFNPEAKVQDYDMKGFYSALQGKDPRAVSAVDPYDNRIHFPDVWKTPYHETFSNESMYAKPTAPRWSKDGRFLLDNEGSVLFDASKIK